VTPTQLPAALRRLIRERAALRCEYCLLAEDDAFLPHESDHVIAVKHGGVTEAPNLALASTATASRAPTSPLSTLRTAR